MNFIGLVTFYEKRCLIHPDFQLQPWTIISKHDGLREKALITSRSAGKITIIAHAALEFFHLNMIGYP